MISIIIPTYNEESEIGDTLVRLQNAQIPYEIIVSDDKSTDNTVAVARPLASKVLSPDAKFPTIAANRNAGAKSAVGDFFVFIDGDVKIYDAPKFFGIALKRFELDPMLVALTVNIRVIKEHESLADNVIYTIFNWVHRLKNNVLHIGEASGKFQMIRQVAFEQVGGFREDLVTREDADMFIRLSKIGHVRLEPGLTVYHTGRRAHAIGWPRLLTLWMVNTFWVAVFGTSRSRDWLPAKNSGK